MERNELGAIEETRLALYEEVNALVIKDADSYRRAGEISLLLKDIQKKIKDYFKPLKDQAYKAWQAVVQKEKDELAKIIPLDEKLAREMTAYQMEQNRIRYEKQKELEEKLRKEEEEKRLAMAEALAKMGHEKEAEQILEQPVSIPQVKVEAEVPQVNGVSYRTDWDFEIVDESLIPRQFLMVNDKAIRAFVRATKGQQEIPGVRIFAKQVLVRKT